MPINPHFKSQFTGKALGIVYLFNHFNKFLIRNETNGDNSNHKNIPNTIQVLCLNYEKTEYLQSLSLLKTF